MRDFLLRRVGLAILNLVMISIVSFVIIQLPPGDFLTTYVASLGATGASVNQEVIDALKVQFGLEQPQPRLPEPDDVGTSSIRDDAAKYASDPL